MMESPGRVFTQSFSWFFVLFPAHFLSKAASKATVLGLKLSFFTNAQASVAPYSRSMRQSSHSTLRGPV